LSLQVNKTIGVYEVHNCFLSGRKLKIYVAQVMSLHSLLLLLYYYYIV